MQIILSVAPSALASSTAHLRQDQGALAKCQCSSCRSVRIRQRQHEQRQLSQSETDQARAQLPTCRFFAAPGDDTLLPPDYPFDSTPTIGLCGNPEMSGPLGFRALRPCEFKGGPPCPAYAPATATVLARAQAIDTDDTTHIVTLRRKPYGQQARAVFAVVVDDHVVHRIDSADDSDAHSTAQTLFRKQCASYPVATELPATDHPSYIAAVTT